MKQASLNELNELALGTVLKRLTDRLYASIDQIYHDSGIEFHGSWFAPMISISSHGSRSITEVASEIGLSHPAVTHISKQLLAAGLVTESPDPDDGRRRLLRLTAKGRQRLLDLQPVWHGIAETTRNYFERTGHDVFAILKAYEQILQESDLVADTLAAIKRHRQAGIEIIEFEPDLADHFYTLNVEWLKKHFFVEARDEEVLSSPETFIIEPGGSILFARYQQVIIGTCALIPIAPGHYEIAKMAVTKQYQGTGVGRKLLDAVIERFHQCQGQHLELETSSKLVPAISLYQSAGFVQVPPPETASSYQRADFFMHYQPSPSV